MRLSATKVAQLVEKDSGDTLVIVDEATGEEVELSREEVSVLSSAIRYYECGRNE